MMHRVFPIYFPLNIVSVEKNYLLNSRADLRYSEFLKKNLGLLPTFIFCSYVEMWESSFYSR